MDSPKNDTTVNPNDILSVETACLKDNFHIDNTNASTDIKYLHYLINDNPCSEINNSDRDILNEYTQQRNITP